MTRQDKRTPSIGLKFFSLLLLSTVFLCGTLLWPPCVCILCISRNRGKASWLGFFCLLACGHVSSSNCFGGTPLMLIALGKWRRFSSFLPSATGQISPARKGTPSLENSLVFVFNIGDSGSYLLSFPLPCLGAILVLLVSLGRKYLYMSLTSDLFNQEEVTYSGQSCCKTQRSNY